jgi:molecular chaperone GrpE
MERDQASGSAEHAEPAAPQTPHKPKTTVNPENAEETMAEPVPPAQSDSDEVTPAPQGAPATSPDGAGDVVEGAAAPELEVINGEIVVEQAPGDGQSAAAPKPAPDAQASPLAAELSALRSELDERISDLQRISAEYANYRKRVERDRASATEQATAQVVAALLPVLDDIDRAREHGDLVGPFGAVAEQVGATLAKFGLSGFGEVGDAFDPTRHEAVTHQTSAEVTVPTCVGVMRRGYLLGDRLLRAALVAVADPESQ